MSALRAGVYCLATTGGACQRRPGDRCDFWRALPRRPPSSVSAGDSRVRSSFSSSRWWSLQAEHAAAAVFAGILCALAVATRSRVWAPAVAVWLVRRSTKRFVEFAAAWSRRPGHLRALRVTDPWPPVRQDVEFTFAAAATPRWQREFIASTNWRCGTSVLCHCFLDRRRGAGRVTRKPSSLFVRTGTAVRDSDRDRRDARFRHLRERSDRPRGSAGLVVAGVWSKPARAEWMRVGRLRRRVPRRGGARGGSVHAHSDARASSRTSFEVSGSTYSNTRRLNSSEWAVRALRGGVDPDPGRPAAGGARRVHHPQLQTGTRRALGLLEHRIDNWSVQGNCVELPAQNVGWFATLDFGTALANAMRAHYRLSETLGDAGL